MESVRRLEGVYVVFAEPSSFHARWNMRSWKGIEVGGR